MDKELKDKWVAALRSGEWKQTRGKYFDADTGGYCCLGVLTVLAKGVKGEEGKAFDVAVGEGGGERCAGPSETIQKLISMNDDEDKSFAEIAEYIEKNL